MTWYNELGRTELILIGVFFLLYVLFLGRIFRIATALNTSARNTFIKFGLRAIYFALMIIALLGPSFGEISKEIKTVGKDIYLAVDLSLSMNATDIPPSRLEKIKFELKNLVTAFNSDRVGLIIFGSEAFMQCPLTYDQGALNLFIETLNSSLVPHAGTDLGAPLRLALDKLEKEEEKQEENPQRQEVAKVIVLVSDGEDFGEETQDVLSDLESRNIKVFTLGVGTLQGSTIPYRERGFKRDSNGREVITTLKAEPLREIAEQTQGKYFELSEKTNEVSKLQRSINQLEGNLRETRKVDVKANKFYIFLLPALLLVILDILLTVKTLKI